MTNPISWMPFLVIASVLLTFPTESQAISIDVSGGWDLTVNKDNLVSGAGSNLQGIYDSDSIAGSIIIFETLGDANTWRVNVRVGSSSWRDGLGLFIRRSSDGSGTGLISGGTEYMQVLDYDQEFFTGSGNRQDISLQLRLTGMSVQVAPSAYSSTLLFTVLSTN